MMAEKEVETALPVNLTWHFILVVKFKAPLFLHWENNNFVKLGDK